jgi:ABC-2 type transport system permease protein
MAATATPSALEAPRGHRPVPSSATQIFKLTRYQLREYLSSRRFIVLLGIVAVIGAILSAVFGYYRTSLSAPGGLLSSGLAFYGSVWGGAVGFVIVLAAVIFGGDAIAGEFQNKTGYFLMGQPVRRASVYIGKYIAALIASICVVLLFLAVLLLNGAYYFGAGLAPWQLGPSVLLAIAYLAAVLGTTFLFSSLFKTSAYGFVLTAVLFLFGFTLLQDLVSGLVKTQPWMVISFASGAIGDVFAPTVNWGLSATVSTIHLGPRGGGEVTTYTPGVAEGIVIMLAYLVVTALAGLGLFEREEFT